MQDANPFVSQRPNDGVVLFALVRVVLHIVARPLAVGDREAAKLVKGLPVKLGTSRASIHDSAFAAALGHRSTYADTYFDLIEALEQLFGRPVDLVTKSAIKNPYFRESIERNQALLYAA